MCKKIYNPKEAICLLLYAEKKTVEKIEKKLYGKRNSRLPILLKILRNEKKIIRSIGQDGRYHEYQTNPKTLLDYIIKLGKSKNIQFTDEEKTKLLKYFKNSDFKEFVKKYSGYISDPKNTLYSFYGLVDYISINSIHIFHVAEYIEKKEKIIADIGMAKLGLPLLIKIGKLTDRAPLISSHYSRFIELVDTYYNIKNESGKSNKKASNGRGLS